MIIVGIDASINSSGLVSFDLDSNLCAISADYLSFTQVKRNSSEKTHHYSKSQFGCYIEQNVWMCDRIYAFCSAAEYVALEDYAFAAKGKVFHIAEFTGAIKQRLFLSGKSIRLYDPPTIKMFATKKGNADKIRMVDEYDTNPLWHDRINLDYLIDQKRPNSRYDSPRSDLVDAFFIAKLLQLELLLRNGKLSMSRQNKCIVSIFTRKTKANPINLLNRNFMKAVM